VPLIRERWVLICAGVDVSGCAPPARSAQGPTFTDDVTHYAWTYVYVRCVPNLRVFTAEPDKSCLIYSTVLNHLTTTTSDFM